MNFDVKNLLISGGQLVAGTTPISNFAWMNNGEVGPQQAEQMLEQLKQEQEDLANHQRSEEGDADVELMLVYHSAEDVMSGETAPIALYISFAGSPGGDTLATWSGKNEGEAEAFAKAAAEALGVDLAIQHDSTLIVTLPE